MNKAVATTCSCFTCPCDMVASVCQPILLMVSKLSKGYNWVLGNWMSVGWSCDGVASHAGGRGVEIFLVVNARETRISFSSMEPLAWRNISWMTWYSSYQPVCKRSFCSLSKWKETVREKVGNSKTRICNIRTGKKACGILHSSKGEHAK